MFNQTQIKGIYFVCIFILGHMKGIYYTPAEPKPKQLQTALMSVLKQFRSDILYSFTLC